MLVLPDGRIAVVDLEEAGPGDPMLDVGNFLAHLRWASCFSSEEETAHSSSYHNALRNSAIERFAWRRSDLVLREAVCLFRICTNPVRRPRADWLDRLQTALAEVNEVLN